MKRKISIAFLIAIITTMMSLSVLANSTTSTISTTEVDPYATMLISLDPEIDYISETNDYATMPITNDSTIKVQLDGNYLDFTDENGNVVNPEIISDRTMVPMRKIFETFNAEVTWSGETRTVVATTEEKEITLTIDSNKAKLKDLVNNEEKEIELDAAPVILNDRTMVPVRFIAESLEKEVGWDSNNRTVIIIDFDKIEKALEEKVPMLKEFFEIEIEALKSFKSTSEISGKIVYKDSEEKSNNETVKIDGKLKMNMNAEQEMEMYINLAFDGKGTIYDSLKEAVTDELEFAIVVADGKAYSMMANEGEEIWTEVGDVEELVEALSTIQNIANPKSYAEYTELLKTSLGELNVTTYATMQQMIEIYAEIYSEDNIKISGSESKKTIKMEYDFKEILAKVVPEILETLGNMELKMSMSEKISNKQVKSAEIVLEMSMAEPTTEENFEIEIELDMDFNSVNKDFEIVAPKVTVE